MSAIFFFQLRRNLRAVSTYVYMLVLFVAAAIQMAFAVGAFSEGRDFATLALANSPAMLAETTGVFAIFSSFVIAAVMAEAATVDQTRRMRELVFYRPIAPVSYWLARYTASVVTASLILLSIPAGLWFATVLPSAQPERLMAAGASAYLLPWFYLLVCNTLALGAIFFTIAGLSGRAFLAQAAAVVAFLGVQLARIMARKLDEEDRFSFFDPFGNAALRAVTKYWTAAERNSEAIALTGRLLENRVIWLALGLGVLALGAWRFAPRRARVTGKAQKDVDRAIPALAPVALTRTPLSKLAVVRLAWDDLRGVMRGPVFWVLLAAGFLLYAFSTRALGVMMDTTTYPVTYQVLDLLQNAFGLPLMILTVLMAGELVWRERDAGMEQVTGALPVPTSVFAIRAVLALSFLTLAIHAIELPVGVITQAAYGYFDFEIGHYFAELFLISTPGFLTYALLALSLQTLIQHKYAAHFLVVLIYVLVGFLPNMGVEHGLFRFGFVPEYHFSAMNGYGHYARPVTAYVAHWLLVGVAMYAAATAFWQRGTEGNGLRQRKKRVPWLLAGSALGLACVTGAYIAYETRVAHPFLTEFESDDLVASYEKTYKAKWENAPTPRVTATAVDVDMKPSERKLRATAEQTLQANEVVAQLLLNVPSEAVFETVTVEGHEISKASDPDRGVHILSFSPPLLGKKVLKTTLSYHERGFRERDVWLTRSLVENGTFLNEGLVPQIGYQSDAELTQESRRKRHGLQPKPRALDLDDPRGRLRNTLSPSADFGELSFKVKTEDGQIALAPGKPGEIIPNALPFFTVLSGRYELARTTHNGVDVEIYYHKQHAFNVTRMQQAVKDSLDYFGAAFGPYQSKVLRIVEFPRYASFAQSFTTTVPFSEAIGFIARVDEDSDEEVDYPYAITAHEVAHQWWGHQVDAAHVQGETFLIESLAEYSCLMMLRKTHGEAHMRRFLRHELDGYLRGRARSRFPETPLMRVEGDPHIRYQKGALALYGLMDAIGEEPMNRALGRFAEAWRYKGPPYPTSRDVLLELKKETPENKQYLIKDLFETITLFDLRAKSAKAKDGAVTLTVLSSKARADGLGKEKPEPLDQLLDVGLVDKHGVPAFLEKRAVKGGEQQIVLTLPPEVWAKRGELRAGIDPLHKMIDRVADDNLVAIEE